MKIFVQNLLRMSIRNSRVGTVVSNGEETQYSSAKLILEGVGYLSEIELFGSADNPFVDCPNLFLADEDFKQPEPINSMTLYVHDVTSIVLKKQEREGHEWLSVEIKSSRENGGLSADIFPITLVGCLKSFSAKEGEMMPTYKPYVA